MWRLRRIIAQNLCVFRELDYHLGQGVTTLVFGNNHDNESQRSNGSGKSALLEAIAVGITGSPMRKVKNEEIIRDDADESWVCLTFDNDASDEVFTVERQLSRKGASVVTCHIERAGQAVETDEAVQPSVDAYNKYILEKLGITREELYNNFLLSRYKYSDFLSSSDKDKKEIINRFSNANLVDQAIECLETDCTPIEKAVRDTELELAGIDGRIGMLQEQIGAEEKNREEYGRRKEEQIGELENRMAGKRTVVRECREQMVLEREVLEKLAVADTALQTLENGECSLEDCFAYIMENVTPLLPGKLTDWNGVLADKKQQLRQVEAQLRECDEQLDNVETALRQTKSMYGKLASDFHVFETESRKRQTEYDLELKKLEKELNAVDSRLHELKRQKRQLSTQIETLRNKLAGTIACPACGHEFIVADRDFDVEAGRGELALSEKNTRSLTEEIERKDTVLAEIETSEERIRGEKRTLNQKIQNWSEQLSAACRQVEDATRQQENVTSSRQRTVSRIASLQEDMDGLRRRLFDEVFGLLDEAYKKQERNIRNLEEEITTAENAIGTVQDTIRELKNASPEEACESLRKSLKDCRIKSGEIMERKTGEEARLRVFQEQAQRFMQFKTYLANTKIGALAQVTNGFLESIGSDIRIRFAGYTVLKTGKVREKISISLLRDGMDCGSFGKFSAGEAARVNLATILAMQKLVNANCEGDKGLDLLVLDEILEAVDEEGLSSMFAALNTLGITALVVSHGNVAEGYPYKLLITKEHGESKID